MRFSAVAAATVRMSPATAMTDADTVRMPVVPPAGSGKTDSIKTNSGKSGFGDGIALGLSQSIGSVSGLVGWVLASRIIDEAQFGLAGKFVSVFMLVGGITQLNLGVGLLRWVPPAGRRAARLIWTAQSMVVPLAALVGLVYVLLDPSIAVTAAGGGPLWWGIGLFVLATAGWSVFVIHDFLLVAMEKPWWTVWRNAAFAVVRIGLLVVLCLAGFGAQGVVLSWVIPIVLWAVGSALVLVVVTRRFSRKSDAGTLPSRPEAVRFLGPTAIGQLAATLQYNFVPALVIGNFGPVIGGKFFLVWQAVTVVEVTAVFFMNSLAVGVAREPFRVAELAAAARRRLLMIFLPALALGALVAGPVLNLIFGPSYAEADDILRLVLLGLAFRLVVVHELGVRQAIGQAMQYARLQLISSLLVLVVAVLVRSDSPDSVTALVPLAIGYVAVQVACAAAVLFFPARRRTDAEVPSP